MFEALYASGWQFPWGILQLQLIALAWLLARYRAIGSRWIAQAAVIMQLLIIADDVSKVPALDGIAAGIVFVILGDLRFLLVVERWGHRTAPPAWRWLGVPLAVSVLVPTMSWLFVQQAAQIANLRVLFVVHELMFAMLALGWLLASRSRGDLPTWQRQWIVRLCGFEFVQYGLWVAADLIILFGVDAGFALRAIPNLMYYVAFVPFMVLTAPRQP